MTKHFLEFRSDTGKQEKLTWEEAMDEFYAPLFSYCLRMLRRREDAEDVTQEVFIRAFRRKEDSTIQPISTSPRSWLYTIAHNLCIDRLRWWKRWRGVLLSEDSVEQTGGEQQEEPATFLAPLIEALPRSQREVFLLRHLHDFSTTDTAQVLGISEGTVKSTLSRAVTRLRQEIERRERK